MAPVITPEQAALDALACMGLGFFAAVLRCLFPLRRPAAAFWADFFCTGAAWILLQGYAAGRSSAGGLRWFMVAAAAVGAAAAMQLLIPLRKRLCRAVRQAAGIPVRCMRKYILRPCAGAIKALVARKKSHRRGKNRAKSPEKQLQTGTELLYNSNV